MIGGTTGAEIRSSPIKAQTICINRAYRNKSRFALQEPEIQQSDWALLPEDRSRRASLQIDANMHAMMGVEACPKAGS